MKRLDTSCKVNIYVVHVQIQSGNRKNCAIHKFTKAHNNKRHDNKIQSIDACNNPMKKLGL